MSITWVLLGVWYYRERLRVLATLIICLPLIVPIHAAGAFWALLSPTDEFYVTDKVPPAEIEDALLHEAIHNERESQRNSRPDT